VPELHLQPCCCCLLWLFAAQLCCLQHQVRSQQRLPLLLHLLSPLLLLLQLQLHLLLPLLLHHLSPPLLLLLHLLPLLPHLLECGLPACMGAQEHGAHTQSRMVSCATSACACWHAQDATCHLLLPVP
jgi:hypothetical protein